MLIGEIPIHLRNTVERLEAPIYIHLTPEACRPPAHLALGDTLMVLGVLRNYGRPVTLHLDPGPDLARLIAGHPQVKDLAPPDAQSPSLPIQRLPVGRSGREATWVSQKSFPVEFPVVPVDQVRANPVLTHSLFYELTSRDDRPGVPPDGRDSSPLAGLLSRRRPTVVIYPLNPGRGDAPWQGLDWWARLIERIRGQAAVVAVGGRDYGGLGEMVDATLAMDDPASRLTDLAWLIAHAQGFVGRDGGVAHLAAGVAPRPVLVWDSMAAYRYWASAAGHHLILSNPYGFRYPQTQRLALPEIMARFKAISRTGPDGQTVDEELPADEEAYKLRIRELFGHFNNFARTIATQDEAEEDRRGIQGWLGQPELKESFYRDSLEFTLRALEGSLPPGTNWVAPVRP